MFLDSSSKVSFTILRNSERCSICVPSGFRHAQVNIAQECSEMLRPSARERRCHTVMRCSTPCALRLRWRSENRSRSRCRTARWRQRKGLSNGCKSPQAACRAEMQGALYADGLAEQWPDYSANIHSHCCDAPPCFCSVWHLAIRPVVQKMLPQLPMQRLVAFATGCTMPLHLYGGISIFRISNPSFISFSRRFLGVQ